MDRPGHNNAVMFIGTEVEHSPAYGMKTLFVIGVQSTEDIEKILDDPYTQIDQKIEHIYFGANHSFPNGRADSRDWTRWENMIMPFIGRGYWCTLDIDVREVEGLLESTLIEYHKFIPMISVKLPYIQQLGYNATIKLDDTNFAHSNPGVWCHSLHSLTNRSSFTDWSKYTKDEVVK
jgi:hypothetical protein